MRPVLDGAVLDGSESAAEIRAWKAGRTHGFNVGMVAGLVGAWIGYVIGMLLARLF